MTLTLSAVICTRDRADWIARSASSLATQDIDPSRLEVLVVDNGSTDDTPAQVARLAATHPCIRYVREDRPGVSVARNAGIAQSSGDVVAFLDDDALASPGWALQYLDAFAADDAVAAAGGRIDLAWPQQRPTWVPERFESMYTCLDLGSDPVDFAPTAMPYGANMALRRTALDVVGPFAVSLGRRSGQDLTSGEERDMFDRLRDHGGRIRYVPGAAAVHHVLPDRVRRSWLLRRAHAQGRTVVLTQELRGRDRVRGYWAGRSAKQYGRAGWFAAVAAAREVTGPHGAAGTDWAARAAHAAGIARESARLAREG